MESSFGELIFVVGGSVQTMQRTGFGSGVGCGAHIGAVEGLVLFLWVRLVGKLLWWDVVWLGGSGGNTRRARSMRNCRVSAFFACRAHVEGKKTLPRAIWSFCSSGAFYVHMNFC